MRKEGQPYAGRRSVNVVFALAELMAAQLDVKRLSADAQHFGGGSTVVAGQFESCLDAHALDDVGRLADDVAQRRPADEALELSDARLAGNECGVTCKLAFRGQARDVTIDGLIIEKYATRAQRGAIYADSGSSGWLIIGPAPAPVARVAGNSRWQLLLHGPMDSELPLPIETDLRSLLPRDVSLAIDPDPLEL